MFKDVAVPAKTKCKSIPLPFDDTKPYYTPSEVVIHNKPYDCWVSLIGKVLNITELIAEFKHDKNIRPLLAFAGKDISHWFDNTSGELQTRIHPVTGTEVAYAPHGVTPNVLPDVPVLKHWAAVVTLSWWRNPKYHIGYLTKKVRPLRIINMLTQKEVLMNFCEEDTFNIIAQKYTKFSAGLHGYAWRYQDRAIEMNKTLTENGIIDERDRFLELGMPSNYYLPSVSLFYKDDLKFYLKLLGINTDSSSDDTAGEEI